MMIVIPMLFNKQLTAVTKRISASNQELIASLNDWLGGLFELRWNGAAKKLWTRISPKAKALEDSYVKNETVDSWIGFFGNITGTISQFALILLASYLSTRGLVTTGVVVSVGDFIYLIFTGLVTMSNNITSHISGKAISEKYQHLLQTKQPADTETNKQVLAGQPQLVKVADLSYEYPNKTIKFPDFTIKEGSKVAIVGPSGVGKTTLMEILSGELTGYQGVAQINDLDIKNIDQESLREKIGIIPQTSHVFETTIAENVLLFDEGLKTELAPTLEKVNLAATVQGMTDGVETVVDPANGTMSGGEMQRISLARALIRGKEFLIMDEGTSALDEANARDIVQRLLNQPEITLLMVTHTSDHQLVAQFDQVIKLGA